MVKIAVTYENGAVFQHFGRTEFFKIYETENGAVLRSEVIGTDGNGHGALAGFLKSRGVDVLLCGGMGGGAKAALAQAGIQVFGGVHGSADQAVDDYLAGCLHSDPNVSCGHHGHGEGHACGDHGCGDHGGESCHS